MRAKGERGEMQDISIEFATSTLGQIHWSKGVQTMSTTEESFRISIDSQLHE